VNVRLLLAAAGTGTRLGAGRPKALVEIAGEPLLVWTLRRFHEMRLARGAVVLATPGAEEEFSAVLENAGLDEGITIVAGGAERQLSVQNGLAALAPDTGIVVIHDAARPFVSERSVRGAIEAAATCGAATVALPAVDTILMGDEDAFLESTPPRERMWLCQTPQVFRRAMIVDAHERAQKDGILVTDDASLVKRYGNPVKLVAGDVDNFKVTTPADIARAEAMLAERLT
jgi:2-C-methyl-D-erythritol 4-phosphate cytidylyltransferase